MLVSALEKKADKIIRISKTRRRVVIDASFNCKGLIVQN